jgi:predicted nucleic acid-binding Zn ribbon protein
MPTYDFRNKDTGEVFEMFMKIAEKEQYLKDNTNIEQALLTAPAFTGDHVAIKKDTGFKEVLQKIHEKTPGSQLNTISSQI